MLSPECLQFSLGAPVVSAKTLFELRDLLASLNFHGDSNRASLDANPREGVDEAIGKTSVRTDEPCTWHVDNGKSRRPTEGPHRRSNGAPRQRSRNTSRRRKRTARKRRGK